MTALGLAFLLFVYFYIIGYGFLALFPTGLKKAVDLLISPIIGVSLVLVLVYSLSRLGLPIKDFASILSTGLLFLALAALFIKRPRLSTKRIILILLGSIAVLTITSWPLIWFGFDWVGVTNDDMANYCLGAQRFYYHGYYEEPNIDDIRLGKDYSQAYWFMHAASGIRSGSELFLAWAWGLTGVDAPRIFMPLISSLHVSLAAATAALTRLNSVKNVYGWLIAFLLFSINPLSTWGVDQQLIAQVGGLGFLVTSTNLLFREIPISREWKIVRKLPSTFLALTGMFIWYPEMTPFLGIGWALFAIRGFAVRGYSCWKVISWPAIVLCAILIFMPSQILGVGMFLLEVGMKFQLINSTIPESTLVTENFLFPYYLIPTGLATFWGLITVFEGIPPDPWATVSFCIAIILTTLLFRLLYNGLANRNHSAAILVVMCVLCIKLYIAKNDFGLYKLAMYAQPFLIALFSSNLPHLQDKTLPLKGFILSSLAAILLLQLHSSYLYTYGTSNQASGANIEIKHASSQGLLTNIRNTFESLKNILDPNKTVLVIQENNLWSAKILAFYSRGLRKVFPSRNFFANIVNFSPLLSNPKEIKNTVPPIYKEENADFNGTILKFSRMTDDLANIYNDPDTTYVFLCKSDIFTSSCNDSVGISKEPPKFLFVHSDIGQHFYLGTLENRAFTQAEKDIYFPGVFSSLGKYLLFQLPNHAQGDRLLLDISATTEKQRGSTLPTVLIKNHNSTVELRFVGRGAGRLYSQSIPAQTIRGVQYTLVDINSNQEYFPNKENLISQIYGTGVIFDTRKISVFARRITMVTDEEYQRFSPPSQLSNFPADLQNPALEYSGIYEDGWISEKSFFILQPKPSAKFLLIRISIPRLSDNSFSSLANVYINGNIAGNIKLGLGAFELAIPVNSPEGRQRVDLEFSNYQQLPNGDNRIVAGKIDFIGFFEN